MSTRRPPVVDCERYHTGLPVRDVADAVDFYTTKLGFTLGFTRGDPLSLAGVNLGGTQIFLERGSPEPAGCTLHFVVGRRGRRSPSSGST